MQDPILKATNLHKAYKMGKVPLEVLRGASLSADKGECVAVLGDSGSGKSTLLHLIAGLDRPDSAGGSAADSSIVFDGQTLASMSVAQRDAYRARTVGIVFQSYHLLTELTALQNVIIAGMVRHGFGYWSNRAAVKKRAAKLLDLVGLGDRSRHRPVELSGGERQRVAIARALINEPSLLLADEPTGNLDEHTAQRVMELLLDLRKQQGITLVMVTHSTAIASRADRMVRIEHGQIQQMPTRELQEHGEHQQDSEAVVGGQVGGRVGGQVGGR